MKKTVLRGIALLLLLVLLVIPTLTSCKKNIYYVKMSFEGFGDIVLELDRKSAPITVDNFVGLVESGYYNGLKVNRSQLGFVIQAGDPKTGGKEEVGTIKGEFSSNGHRGNFIEHVRGVISMARSNDPNSASSQFFICLGDCRASLDGSYAGFGYVVEGMEVVDKIANHLAPYGDAYYGFVSDESYQVTITDAVVLDNYK